MQHELVAEVEEEIENMKPAEDTVEICKSTCLHEFASL